MTTRSHPCKHQPNELVVEKWSVCDNHTSFHCSSGFTMKKWCIITFGRTNSQWETDWLWQLKLICYYAAPRLWKHRQTAVVHGVLRLLRIPFMDCVNAQHFSNDYTFYFLFFALRYTQAQSCVLPLANCGLIFVLQTNLSVWGHTHKHKRKIAMCVTAKQDISRFVMRNKFVLLCSYLRTELKQFLWSRLMKICRQVITFHSGIYTNIHFMSITKKNKWRPENYSKQDVK